jgi:hypothetical protein
MAFTLDDVDGLRGATMVDREAARIDAIVAPAGEEDTP